MAEPEDRQPAGDAACPVCRLQQPHRPRSVLHSGAQQGELGVGVDHQLVAALRGGVQCRVQAEQVVLRDGQGGPSAVADVVRVRLGLVTGQGAARLDIPGLRPGVQRMVELVLAVDQTRQLAQELLLLAHARRRYARPW
ncbi:hypothetical protein ABT299_36395 [Spirillospora sp. NPDC000708]